MLDIDTDRPCRSLFMVAAFIVAAAEKGMALVQARKDLQTDRVAIANRQMSLLYDEAWVPVFRYAFMLLRHREDAEDVCAEAFSRAHQAWADGRGPVGPALPWLLLITRRLVIDRQRRRRLFAWLPLSESRDGVYDAGMTGIARAEVWLWFEQLSRVLPVRQREAVILRYQFDMPDDEIGQIMGLSSAGVRTLVSRAMSALRAHPEMLR